MSDESKLSSYLFFVEIDGIETARFQKCEGLEAETESFEYEEGGGEVHHFQGRTRYPNLVLEKGINDNNELFNWFQSITKDEKVERKNGSIVLKNNDNEELKRWNFFRALPCRWIGPKLDAKDRSSFAVERIEIAQAWAMVESGGSPDAFATDPLQVNNPGDWDDRKTDIAGLTQNQEMTPETSAEAALEWRRYKGYIHDETGAETEWRGDFQAFRRYNGNTNPPPSSATTERTEHRDYYADLVLELGSD